MNSALEVFPLSAQRDGALVGRVRQPGDRAGLTAALFDVEGVFALSCLAPTMSALLEQSDLSGLRQRIVKQEPLCSISELIENSHRFRESESPAIAHAADV